MFTQKQNILGFLILFFVVAKGYGQITATPSFTGCAPYSVVLSGPPGATAPYWTFGSGMGTSTLSSPNPIFVNAGTYNITYTALVNGSPVSYNSQMLVKPPPTGNLSAIIPFSHCAPMTVTFSANGPPNSTFTWDFGDLSGLSPGPNVVHTYSVPNNFVPLLTVLDAVTGCTALATSNTTVHVSAIPVINITSSNGYAACMPPLTTNIDGSTSTSGSPLGGGLTFNWSFNTGSPGSSSAPNPGQVIFGSGQHTLAVVVTDNNQCSNTKTMAVVVETPTLSALMPSTVCINTPFQGTFATNQQSLTVSVVGSTLVNSFSLTPNVPHLEDTVFIMTTPGIHTLVIETQPPGCPVFSITHVLFVEEIIPNFTWTPFTTCSNPMVTNYVNLTTINSGNSFTCKWDIYEEPPPPPATTHGIPSSSVIPGLGTPTFTMWQGSKNPYTLYGPLQPWIQLTVTSSHGCAALTKMATGNILQRPSANFHKSKSQGCSPLEVVFVDQSVVFGQYAVTDYTWCNGASPPTYSTGAAPIPSYGYTYTPGTYYPYLIIKTASGCIDTSFIDTVVVVDPPTITATFPSIVCAGAPVTINMQGNYTPVPPHANGIDHWHIETDEGFFSGCITNSSPTFSFTHIGTHTVQAWAYLAGCASTNTFANTIQVQGPVGKFQYETTCGDQKLMKFKVYLENATTATLDFGDASSLPITGNPLGIVSQVITHSYTTLGDYTITMTTLGNTGCGPYIHKKAIKMRDPQARIMFKNQPIPSSPTALACVNQRYDFTGAFSSDHDLGCGEQYTWFFQTKDYQLAPWGGKHEKFKIKVDSVKVPPNPNWIYSYSYADPIAQDTFRYAGTYTIGLRVMDLNGCVDTTRIVFRISDAKPVFSFSANPACLSDTLRIINTTQGSQFSPDVITKYAWDFGEFTGIVTSTDPNFQPKYKYTATVPPSQVFTVVASAKNNVGCEGTTSRTVQINNPVSGFLENVTTTCLKLGTAAPITFTANPGYATYSVTYGEPPSNPGWQSASNFSTGINVHLYATPGTYTPTLIATDIDGCSSEEKREINIVGQPTAAISLPDGKFGFCRPAQPILTGTNSGFNVQPITNYIWAIGTVSLAPPGSKTLQATYTQPATTVSLTVSMTNKLLCPHTVTVQILTYDPVATAVLTPTIFCVGDKIEASIQIDHDVMMWQWSFGDFVQQPVRYNTPATPTMVTYPYPVFPSGSDNGKTFATLIYYATTDQSNTCRKAESIPIRVIEAKSDFKQSFDVYKHCLNVGDEFNNTSVNISDLSWSYDWEFGDQTIGNGFTTKHTYLKPGVFPVKMTVRENNYGCKATTVKEMTVFPLPTATLVMKETVCPGAPFLIEGSGTPGGSGVLTGTLEPEVNTSPFSFGPNNTFQVNAVITKSTSVILKVKDENSCEGSSSSVMVNAQLAANAVVWDTTIIIGEPVPLNAFAGAGFTYTWTPLVDYLSCETCLIYNPVSTTTTNITYTVAVEDALRCSVVQNTYKINIDLKASLDVPSAFTPNGDGINDIIYPAGWGLKKLVYFRIFNRWGQLIFESNDLSIGWDGVFTGVPQNMETYVYQVSAETYSKQEPVISKTGTFKLLR